MLIAWIIIASVVLAISLLVHVATFFAINPMDVVPGVMWIHALIFLPFIAAIIYAGKSQKFKGNGQSEVWNQSPRWLRATMYCFFAYAFLNFILFSVLGESANAYEEAGKYILREKGNFIRELTQAEFHQHQALTVRGFSGHWMLFSCAALTFLVGARKLAEQRPDAIEDRDSKFSNEETPDQHVVMDDHEEAAEPTTFKAALIALAGYLICLFLIFSGASFLSMLCIPVLLASSVMALRRRRGFPKKSFESGIGCLSVIPNFFIAIYFGGRIVDFVYILVFAGIEPAVTNSVVFVPATGDEPRRLSNGEAVHNGVLTALFFFVQFPLTAVGVCGLTFLAEHVGRFIEVRRKRQKSNLASRD